MNTPARPLQGARPPQRIAIVLRSILVLAVVLAVLAAGLLAFHRHRKAAALRTALDQGRAAFEARQYSQAAALLGQCLAAGNQDPDVILKYAEARIRSRPRTRAAQQDAINVLERLLRTVRGHEEASALLVPWYLQADQPVDAERVARAWSEAHPDNPAAGRALAAALLAGKKTSRAMELLEQLLRRHPEDIEAVAALASARLRQALESNDSAGIDQARALLDETVQRHPASPEARLVRARFLVATGRLAEALPDLEAARASDSAATLLAVGQLW